MSTMDDLKEAFAGESQANRKYLAFAKKADDEGYAQVAKLFRAAADAETVHAHAHLRVMGGIGSTEDNLKEAIGGETEEFKSMYPGMIERAKAEQRRHRVLRQRQRWRSTPALREGLGQPGGNRRPTTCARCAATPWRKPGEVPHLRRPQEDVQEID